MKKKILIYNYMWCAGGTLVLSTLVKTLRECGINAEMLIAPWCDSSVYRKKSIFIKDWIKFIIAVILKRNFKGVTYYPHASLSVRGVKVKWLPIFSKKNTIVIYPEIVKGNPLKVKNVVRWLLYHYKFENDKTAYSSTDFFIAYRKIFNSSTLNPHNHTLKLYYFNKDLYKHYNFGERKGVCYILRKGKNRTDLPKTFDGPVYDDDMPQEELVKMFNEHAYCYIYDTQTFYAKIAAVCGCIPIVMLEKNKTERDYLSEEEKHYGVAYGNTKEQIEYAKSTRELLLKSLDYDEMNKQNVLNFIELLKERFGELKSI